MEKQFFIDVCSCMFARVAWSEIDTNIAANVSDVF